MMLLLQFHSEGWTMAKEYEQHELTDQ